MHHAWLSYKKVSVHADKSPSKNKQQTTGQSGHRTVVSSSNADKYLEDFQATCINVLLAVFPDV